MNMGFLQVALVSIMVPKKIGATVIPISGGNTKRQVMLMQDFGSTHLTCTPSYALLSETDVIAVEVSDKPCGLAEVLDILGDAWINVEYMYAFVEKSSDNAVVIFRIENIDTAIKALQAKQVMILNNEKITHIWEPIFMERKGNAYEKKMLT